MYRLTRFSHENGDVDVVSGSAVGGGSLFYSGVNLIPHKPVLDRIGLGHLTSQDFQNAGKWMKRFRGKINKINTKIPVPHYRPCPENIEADPQHYYQLGVIPESGEQVPTTLDFEMPNPDLAGKHDSDFLLLDRARVLKRALKRVLDSGGFRDGAATGKLSGQFEPLPLSVVEYDPENNSDSTDNNTFCSRDGRCILGCLPSARHTLYKTVQKLRENGDDITVLPRTKVSHIDRIGDQYLVHFESELDGEEGKLTQAAAPQIYLAAGCLGTVEIMLRTKELFDRSGGEQGLPLSVRPGTL